MKIMESPQLYDSSQPLVQIELKKVAMANNNNNNNTPNNNNNNNDNNNNNNTTNNNNNTTPNHNNNNSVNAINHNLIATKQQQQQQHHQNNNNNNNNTTNNNNNIILQKHLVPQYTQSDIDELTSQEISLDLQHLIDDQFRAEQESLGIFTEIVNGNSNSNNTTNGLNGNSNKMNVHNNRSQQNQFSRITLPYMPQPVHTGATYTNSSDENSSVGSDVASSIKEEPVDPIEYRRQLVASTGLYSIPPNYASNGSGNSFTTLTPSTVLHHQGIGGHLNGNHLSGLKNKQMSLSQRKQQAKVVDKGTDEYRRRRERNNIAVRKSREKAKVRSREVEEKVKTLVKEKEVLIRRLEEMTNEIQLHKQLYMHLMNHSNPEINQICRNVLSLVNINDHGNETQTQDSTMWDDTRWEGHEKSYNKISNTALCWI